MAYQPHRDMCIPSTIINRSKFILMKLRYIVWNSVTICTLQRNKSLRPVLSECLWRPFCLKNAQKACSCIVIDSYAFVGILSSFGDSWIRGLTTNRLRIYHKSHKYTPKPVRAFSYYTYLEENPMNCQEFNFNSTWFVDAFGIFLTDS